MNTVISRHRKLWAIAAFMGLASLARAHNLDQRDTSISIDDAFLNVMTQRYTLGQTLIQDDDEFWMVFRSTPGPGTATGVGGYLTFYIPTNYVEVTGGKLSDPHAGVGGNP